MQFSLLGIPIRIDWPFWLIGLLFGYPFFANPGREGLITLLIWMAVWILSFVIHEMGHALCFRMFGGRDVRIHLYGFGGYATASGRFTRKQHLLISAAGPGVEIGFGIVALLILRVAGANTLPHYPSLFLTLFGFICIFWGLINLVPVYPLDGGQIVDAALGKGPRVTAQIGVVAGVIAAVVLFVLFKSLVGALFMGYLAFQNWQRLQQGAR